MNNVNITSSDIVKSMTDENKDQLAKYCIANHIEPENIIEPISKAINGAINAGIDLINNYFETPEGKQYLNMRKKIENIGNKY